MSLTVTWLVDPCQNLCQRSIKRLSQTLRAPWHAWVVGKLGCGAKITN